MLTKTSHQSRYICHRCKQPMTFSSDQRVGEKHVHVYKCESCGTSEAFEQRAN